VVIVRSTMAARISNIESLGTLLFFRKIHRICRYISFGYGLNLDQAQYSPIHSQAQAISVQHMALDAHLFFLVFF
jgi:hypothetical protein